MNYSNSKAIGNGRINYRISKIIINNMKAVLHQLKLKLLMFAVVLLISFLNFSVFAKFYIKE